MTANYNAKNIQIKSITDIAPLYSYKLNGVSSIKADISDVFVCAETYILKYLIKRNIDIINAVYKFRA